MDLTQVQLDELLELEYIEGLYGLVLPDEMRDLTRKNSAQIPGAFITLYVESGAAGAGTAIQDAIDDREVLTKQLVPVITMILDEEDSVILAKDSEGYLYITGDGTYRFQPGPEGQGLIKERVSDITIEDIFLQAEKDGYVVFPPNSEDESDIPDINLTDVFVEKGDMPVIAGMEMLGKFMGKASKKDFEERMDQGGGHAYSYLVNGEFWLKGQGLIDAILDLRLDKGQRETLFGNLAEDKESQGYVELRPDQLRKLADNGYTLDYNYDSLDAEDVKIYITFGKEGADKALKDMEDQRTILIDELVPNLAQADKDGNSVILAQDADENYYYITENGTFLSLIDGKPKISDVTVNDIFLIAEQNDLIVFPANPEIESAIKDIDLTYKKDEDAIPEEPVQGMPKVQINDISVDILGKAMGKNSKAEEAIRVNYGGIHANGRYITDKRPEFLSRFSEKMGEEIDVSGVETQHFWLIDADAVEAILRLSLREDQRLALFGVPDYDNPGEFTQESQGYVDLDRAQIDRLRTVYKIDIPMKGHETSVRVYVEFGVEGAMRELKRLVEVRRNNLIRLANDLSDALPGYGAVILGIPDPFNLGEYMLITGEADVNKIINKVGRDKVYTENPANSAIPDINLVTESGETPSEPKTITFDNDFTLPSGKVIPKGTYTISKAMGLASKVEHLEKLEVNIKELNEYIRELERNIKIAEQGVSMAEGYSGFFLVDPDTDEIVDDPDDSTRGYAITGKEKFMEIIDLVIDQGKTYEDIPMYDPTIEGDGEEELPPLDSPIITWEGEEYKLLKVEGLGAAQENKRRLNEGGFRIAGEVWVIGQDTVQELLNNITQRQVVELIYDKIPMVDPDTGKVVIDPDTGKSKLVSRGYFTRPDGKKVWVEFGVIGAERHVAELEEDFERGILASIEYVDDDHLDYLKLTAIY
ncbi:MAG: hypothetical protein KJ906_04555, partial [Nanoarchaeota archaeon]|nr:hypothetical protein [Nanoarchaeota archaeon]